MATITIRDDLDGPVPDTWLNELSPTANKGSDTTFEVGFSTGFGGKSSRGLLKFPLAALPGGAVILTAKIGLTVSVGAGTAEAARVRRVTQSGWLEGEATWDDYKSATAWAAAGGDYTATDEVNWTLPTGTGDIEIAGLKTLVEDAIANRGGDLHVILMRATEASVTSVVTLRSGEYATAAERPRLIVDYLLPGGVIRSRAGRRAPHIAGVIS